MPFKRALTCLLVLAAALCLALAQDEHSNTTALRERGVTADALVVAEHGSLRNPSYDLVVTTSTGTQVKLTATDVGDAPTPSDVVRVIYDPQDLRNVRDADLHPDETGAYSWLAVALCLLVAVPVARRRLTRRSPHAATGA